MTFPDLNYEIELWKNGYSVIGIDEVGRGSFAGPLVVCGVVFNSTANEERLAKLLSYGINDSKKLKHTERKKLAEIIKSECLTHYISSIDVNKINKIGIGKATYSAAREIVKKLSVDRPYVLMDGFRIKYVKGVGLKNQKGIVKGDSLCLSIAAASIIAKVTRDEYMRKLAHDFPKYGWGRNKGYGSLEHRNAIREFGPTIHHRTDFIENFIKPF
ncbi:MAG TPA: ribonuclease HII [Patescibacteria group bacterium]|nr:ribonuclease HII [Patescibacteria group bacterium]